MRHGSYFYYPATVGIAGAAMVIGVAGFTLAGAAMAAILVAMGAGVGARLRAVGCREMQSAGEAAGRQFAVANRLSALQDICVRTMPVWAKQLHTSRVEGDQAVAALSSLFSGTVRRLSKAVAASRSAVSELSVGGGVHATIDRSDEDLRGVAETLRRLQVSKQAILDEVKRSAKDLKEMSQSVQHIALQVRILSFNAAIEAARAGESGQSFGVVAAEMRELARLSAETGAQMTKKVEGIEHIDATLAGLFRDAHGAEQRGDDSIAKAESAIKEVMERFKGLTTKLSGAVETMESESEGVSREISDALVELQFQDRVSQIVAHVADGCTSLNDRVERKSSALDANEWIAEMTQSFSTHEEFANLGHAPERAPQLEHMTFF